VAHRNLWTHNMGDQPNSTQSAAPRFSFFKGGEDVIAEKNETTFDWTRAAAKVRSHLNAKNVAFLLGSGCSSHVDGDRQLGVPTMAPMAQAFLAKIGTDSDRSSMSRADRDMLHETLGLSVEADEYAKNLERLMEVLFSADFVLRRSTKPGLAEAATMVRSVIAKVTRHVFEACTQGPFATGDETVLNTYKAFYRNLVYRDRALPRPWIFTTNYDLFNETALDRLAVPYCNGFLGTVERRFSPATFRYSLAEQLDITSRKWTAVEGFVYLCKLHGSRKARDAPDRS
jgi:hypothetical protein